MRKGLHNNRKGTLNMGSRTIQKLWNQIEDLDLTPTEALVLTALAHYASDDFGYCHPRQDQLSRKSKLGNTATKASLRSLRRKGIVRWSGKPKHPNEYVLPFSSSNASNTRDKSSEGAPAPNGGAVVEGAACTLLAQTFAALLADSKQRLNASLDYTKPLKRIGFLAGFRLLFGIKSKLRGLPDDEIHARILNALAQSGQERKPNG